MNASDALKVNVTSSSSELVEFSLVDMFVARFQKKKARDSLAVSVKLRLLRKLENR